MEKTNRIVGMYSSSIKDKMTSYLQKYVDCIKNAGESYTISQFDDDWEPIGPTVRKDLVKAGLVEEIDGKLKIK
jgi:hypothetical protein